MGSNLSKSSLKLWDDLFIHTTAKQPGCMQKVYKCQQTPVVIAIKLELQAGWDASIMQKKHMQENENKEVTKSK